MNEFRFDFGQRVCLTLTGESGIVVGKCHYMNNECQYAIRYVAADGRQVESWLQESALEPEVTLE
jgi:hypothetical protein